MTNRTNRITKMHMLVGLMAIAALCIALPVSATAGKPPTQSSGKGKGGGSSGGGTGGSGSGGTFYPTASSVAELVADINYADTAGGAFTINLAPGTTFYITSLNNSTDGGNALPVVGGTKAVNLTIICNGDTIEGTRFYTKTGYLVIFHLFDVAAGSSLTLDHVTLQGGTADGVLNQGTLNIINGSTVYSNGNGGDGGGLYNAGGTMTVSNSIVSGNYGVHGGNICNGNGTVTLSGCAVSIGDVILNGAGGGIYNNGGMAIISCTLANNGCEGGVGGAIYNAANGTVTISNSTLTNNAVTDFRYSGPGGGYGGAIYNHGTVEIDNCTLSGNSADQDGGAIFNDVDGTVTVNHCIISGNVAVGFNGGDFVDPGFGGGICNSGTLTVENSSQIKGNSAMDYSGNVYNGDVYNGGVLYQDNSEIDDLETGFAFSPGW